MPALTMYTAAGGTPVLNATPSEIPVLQKFRDGYLAHFLSILVSVIPVVGMANSTTAAMRSVTISNSEPRSVDGVGIKARFGRISCMVFDSKANLFVTDPADHVIRKITPSAEVSTFAGAPGQVGHDDGVGTRARFASPSCIAIDANDNLYVTDADNETIREITPAAEVTTIAGTDGHAGYKDGVGIAAEFNLPQGITIDAFGNLYVVVVGAIRKMTPAGQVTTLAGTSSYGELFGYRDGMGSSARFSSPGSIVVDAHNHLFVSDLGNALIREISLTGEVSTFAGRARSTVGQNEGSETTQFVAPGGLAFDGEGNLYVADTARHTETLAKPIVRKISQAGVATTVLVATKGKGLHYDVAALRDIAYASAIAVDSTGAVYISVGAGLPHQKGDDAIVKISPSGKVSMFAGHAVDIVQD